MTDLPRPTILKGSRSKAVKLVVFGLACVAVGAFLFLKGINRGIGAITVVACSYLIVQGLRAWVNPPELEIDDDGLRWRGTRPWRVAWADVKEFSVWRSRRASAVRIAYVSAKPQGRSRGPDCIPNTLWIEPDELAELLAVRLDEARARGTAQPRQFSLEQPEVSPPVIKWPRFSLVLIVVLAAVFASELLFPLTEPSSPLTPSTVTLAGSGGLGLNLLTGPSEWYRFATAPFLHGGPGHLLANGFALFLAGRLLEGVVGLGWFAAIYVAGALAGGCGSLLANPANVVSVGASGAIVALFAAAYVCSFHYPRLGGRQRLQSGAISVLLPTLFSVGRTTGGMHIDFGAHLGGAVGGLVMGAAILLTWREPGERPSYQRIGAAIGFAGLLFAAVAVWPAASDHDLFSRMAFLVPDTLMPKSDAEIVAQVTELEPRFPRDPRLHLAAAMGDMEKGDPVQAADEARIGLQDMDAVRAFLKASVEADLWLVLGESFMQRGLKDEARANYDKAATLDAQLPGLDFDQGKLNLANGRLGEAMKSAKAATERQASAPAAWRLLGDVLFAKGDIADALNAYKHQSELLPSQSSFRMTGLTRFYTRDAEGALLDLKQGVQDGRVGYYSALWLDIVAERSGKPRTLEATSLVVGDRLWPAPILDLFLGNMTPDTLRLAATSAAPNPGQAQTCEADFYISEWSLIHNDGSQADDGFRRAMEECPPDFVEGWMAKAELASSAVKSP